MSLEPVHFSRLRLMALSAAHYLAAEERAEETPAMRFGSLTHVLSLGGEVVRYDGKRAGNPWRAFEKLVAGVECFVYDGVHQGKAWQAAKLEAAGRPIVTSTDVELATAPRALQARRRAAGLHLAPIVTSAEYERAQVCAEAVRRHPIAGELLEGEREAGLSWTRMGRACAGHLDVLGPRRVVELKASASAEPEWFVRHAIRMAWHAQLDWYAHGAIENGCAVDGCYVIAVETRAPYPVTCLRLTDRALEQGAKINRLWMERLLACEAADAWPEYVQSVVELDVPDDFELDFGEAA